MSENHEPDDSLVGTVLDGRYKIERILGVGGMGAVYQGRHELLGTPIAVKVMRSTQPNAAERFLAEARRTFRLDHPNCVRATDAGVAPDDLLYLVMELLEGRTLGEELDNDGRIAPHRVAHIGVQVAAAIGCAHDLGYVHRDLKPDNIMLLHRGRDPDFVKVLDFGLAKLTDEAKLAGKHSVMSFTRNGMVFGTPHYMSPEQAQGHRLDPRSDIYSLGVVLYEALAGGPPFDSDSEVEVLIAHVQTPPPPVSDYCDASPEFEQTLMRMLAKRPEERPASAEEVIELLSHVGAQTVGRPSGVRPSIAASETLALPEGVSSELQAIGPPAMPAEPPEVARNATAPTRAITPSRPRPPSRVVETDDLPALRSPRRAPLFVAGGILLALAASVSIWAMSQSATTTVDAGPTQVAVVDARAPTTTPIDAGPADAKPTDGSPILAASDAALDVALDAAVDATTGAVDGPKRTAAQRKAESLYRRAMAAKRSGKGELSYLPKLQSAYRLDRKNRKIRRALVGALLGSKDKAQRTLGCRMIRRDKKRYKREGCAGSN